LFSSPPKTRWSNCFECCSGMSAMLLNPRGYAIYKDAGGPVILTFAQERAETGCEY
jgi:hypothetical protein